MQPNTLQAGLVAMLLTLAPAAMAQSQSPELTKDLTKVLAELDTAAAHFQTAQADFAWDQYTAVVQSHDVQKGTIAFRRGAKPIAMVAHVLTDDGQPAPKDVLFKDGEVDLYQPLIKQETIVGSVGQYESYSTLGFGGSGRDLSAQWNVIYVGPERIDGIETAKLDLTFKHPSPNAMFTRITIWVDPMHATSLKQVFYEPSGDMRTATYTNIVLNKAPDKVFELKVPKGTTVIRK